MLNAVFYFLVCLTPLIIPPTVYVVSYSASGTASHVVSGMHILSWLIISF